MNLSYQARFDTRNLVSLGSRVFFPLGKCENLDFCLYQSLEIVSLVQISVDFPERKVFDKAVKVENWGRQGLRHLKAKKTEDMPPTTSRTTKLVFVWVKNSLKIKGPWRVAELSQDSQVGRSELTNKNQILVLCQGGTKKRLYISYKLLKLTLESFSPITHFLGRQETQNEWRKASSWPGVDSWRCVEDVAKDLSRVVHWKTLRLFLGR